MQSLLRFLSHYEYFFYILLGIVFLVFVNKSIKAWREWSSAVYGMEKEHSQRKVNQSISILAFTALLLIGLFVVNTFVTPAVPGIQQLATPTIDFTPMAETPTGGPTVAVTAQGFIPTITSYLSRGCIPDQIDWTDPRNGDSISGMIQLKGTVNITDLGYYKYEYSPLGADTWTTIAAGNTKVVNDALGGTWDTGNLVPGDYELRLVVFDHQNNQFPGCMIQVTISTSE